MPEFDTLSEVILYVENMDEMLAFYRDILGLAVVAGDPEYGFVKLDAGSTSLCLHAGRDGKVGKFAPKIVFDVDDLDAAAAYLRDHDVELGEKRQAGPDSEVVDGMDPEGNKFAIEAPVSE